jgi:hypothetical protein
MKNFIKGILTDSDGKPSAKRVSLFLFVFTFITVDFVNLFLGKKMDETLTNQLFYLLMYVISVVFGEKIAGIFTKSDPK